LNPGGQLAPDPLTTAGVLLAQTSRLPTRSAVVSHREGRWRSVSWSELREQVLRVACGLVGAGVEAGDRVLLLSENRVEWLACDLGIQVAGAVTVPVHPSASPDAAQAIAASSGAFLAIASGEERAARLHLTDALGRILRMDGEVARWLGALIEERLLREVARRLSRLGPNDAATIVFLGGDAGRPVHVVLTHLACVEMASRCVEAFDVGPSDSMLSIRSFADAAERLWGVLVPITSGATVWISRGAHVLDADVDTVRPTVMNCSPLVLEQFRRRAEDEVTRPSRPGRPRLWHRLADRRALSSLRRHVGGGRLRFLVTGDAPLPSDTAEFFRAIDLPVHEGVGAVDEHGFRAVAWPKRESS
jgi:long-chain acyl-CoA synthetase